MQARTLDDCLNADATMARLAAHAKRLMKLQQTLTATVPSALAKLCRVANYNDGVVVIHADNAAIAAKLRQMVTRIGDALRSSATEVTEIRIKVQARADSSAAARSSEATVISEKAKHALTSLHDSLPDEAPLKASIERLVGRSKLS